jgi:hypothetical protein
MQQSWRQLAVDMEQQHCTMLQQLQTPDSTVESAAAQAKLCAARSASFAGLLLQLWTHFMIDKAGPQEQPSKLSQAASSTAFSEAAAVAIAAIWRIEGALHPSHAVNSNAAAASSRAGHVVRGVTTTLGASAAPPATAPEEQQRQQQQQRQSTRLLPGRKAGEEAVGLLHSAVSCSLVAAEKLIKRLVVNIVRHSGAVAGTDQQLPGSSAAHNLQWVMLVYTALLVAGLHRQQQGLTAVQLHTTQPASTDHSNSSSIQQGLQTRIGANSSKRSSSSSAGSSRIQSTGKAGSSKKGTGKKASRASQASSSSATATTGSLLTQHSIVPPYHLDLLRVAGVRSFKDDRELTDAQSKLLNSTKLPAAVLVLHTLLQELGRAMLTEQRGTPSPAVATGSCSSSSSSSNHSSSTVGGSSAVSISPCSSTPIPSDVLALLAPCSLVCGEMLALCAGSSLDVDYVMDLTMLAKLVSQSSYHIVQQRAFSEEVCQLQDLVQMAELSGIPLAPGEPPELEVEHKVRLKNLLLHVVRFEGLRRRNLMHHSVTISCLLS